jgi:hypothetical protein
MKYIVYYFIVSFVSTPCPTTPVADKFGRVPTYYISCAAIHMKKHYEPKLKSFDHLDSANSFVKEMAQENKKMQVMVYNGFDSGAIVDSIVISQLGSQYFDSVRIEIIKP